MAYSAERGEKNARQTPDRESYRDNEAGRTGSGDAAVVPTRGQRQSTVPRTVASYDGSVVRLAYELWLLRADRNCQKTSRLLYDELKDDLPQTPSASQIRGWRDEYQWELNAQEDIKSVAQMLNERQFLRFFVASEEAAKELVRIALNDHEEQDARRLAVIKDACIEIIRIRGLGTAGGYAPPAIPHATVRLGENSTTSPQELSRQIREAILEEKQQQSTDSRGNKR